MNGGRTGSLDLPLHGGRAPRWLYERMVTLAGLMLEVMLEEFPTADILARFADPFWFQAFGSLLGFDWHSSGLTTVTLGAVKQALAARPRWPLHAAGGKGRASRRTPDEIRAAADGAGIHRGEALVGASRLAAKVDGAALQDGFQLYHHVFLFDDAGEWAVVQQGMQGAEGRYARRYHWFSRRVTDPVDRPHSGLAGDRARGPVLDLTSSASAAARQGMVTAVREVPPAAMVDLIARRPGGGVLPAGHAIPDAARIDRRLLALYEQPPADFRSLLEREGVGPATVRALCMVAEVIYGVQASRTDPLRYAFAHGGKDGHPFPVSRPLYDDSIAMLRRVADRTRLDHSEKRAALARLAAVARAAGSEQ
ncbi:conserved protein of unknown function [Candidatus Hydrogenisulfobacillus filiaventi]|uniref:DUF763 domain-containing protein n=1 Tax=Candidatus Hydrogenisulfobacillus filiaventi TaxID=2707344 RepID=A0A6F8ZHR8_9FIRM|nr:conserved protein of unknown function [Candidatus Hydrogenisulfobacillus filiaventi]